MHDVHHAWAANVRALGIAHMMVGTGAAIEIKLAVYLRHVLPDNTVKSCPRQESRASIVHNGTWNCDHV